MTAPRPGPPFEPRDIARFRQRDYLALAAIALAFLVGGLALAGATMGVAVFVVSGFVAAALIYRGIALRAARNDLSRHATTASQQVTQFAAAVSDALPQAVAVLDRRGRVVHANRLARELVQIDRLGRPLVVFIRDPGVAERLEQALAGTEPEPLMVRSESPTERYINCLFSAATDIDTGADDTVVLVVMNDVTELMRNTQQRADFLANASHELKTPIASMLGYIETLRGHAADDPEAQQRFLAIMQQQAERMQRLINDLLSLRRIEQNEHVAPTETADLDLSIRAAIESVAPLAEARGVTLKYKRSKRAIVPGHQDEAIQLCLNLIENAAKLSPAGETVRIGLRHFDRWGLDVPFTGGILPEGTPRRTINPAPTVDAPIHTITISDRGPGFARDHLPRIGERFYRVAGDLSSREKGTGLGLAIVKHIARRHRAGLYVRSAEGVGTEWSIVYTAREVDDARGVPIRPTRATTR